MRRDVFQAIADPGRREILAMLSARSLNMNSIAEHFNVSKPAISKQMKILFECGLVTIRKEGREKICEAKLRELKTVSDWVEKYRSFWTGKLDSLEAFLAKENDQQTKR